MPTTPPQAQHPRNTAPHLPSQPVEACVRLKKRADFKRLSASRKAHGRGFSVAQRPHDHLPAPTAARIGFTVTKQCGNAVKRNRIRRRLKEAMRLGAAQMTKSGHDYVIFGRTEAMQENFARLQQQLAAAISSLHRERPKQPSSHPSTTPPPAAPI